MKKEKAIREVMKCFNRTNPEDMQHRTFMSLISACERSKNDLMKLVQSNFGQKSNKDFDIVDIVTHQGFVSTDTLHDQFIVSAIPGYANSYIISMLYSDEDENIGAICPSWQHNTGTYIIMAPSFLRSYAEKRFGRPMMPPEEVVKDIHRIAINKELGSISSSKKTEPWIKHPSGEPALYIQITKVLDGYAEIGSMRDDEDLIILSDYFNQQEVDVMTETVKRDNEMKVQTIIVKNCINTIADLNNLALCDNLDEDLKMKYGYIESANGTRLGCYNFLDRYEASEHVFDIELYHDPIGDKKFIEYGWSDNKPSERTDITGSASEIRRTATYLYAMITTRINEIGWKYSSQCTIDIQGFFHLIDTELFCSDCLLENQPSEWWKIMRSLEYGQEIANAILDEIEKRNPIPTIIEMPPIPEMRAKV